MEETDFEREQRIVTETGEKCRQECVRLALRYNGWMLHALRGDRKSENDLEWRKPEDWKRNVLDELEWMEVLGMVYHDESGWWYAAY